MELQLVFPCDEVRPYNYRGKPGSDWQEKIKIVTFDREVQKLQQISGGQNLLCKDCIFVCDQVSDKPKNKYGCFFFGLKRFFRLAYSRQNSVYLGKKAEFWLKQDLLNLELGQAPVHEHSHSCLLHESLIRTRPPQAKDGVSNSQELGALQNFNQKLVLVKTRVLSI